MPITTFSNFTDGLEPSQRHRDQFVTDTNLDDERLWIPYVDGAWFQACQFNVSSPTLCASVPALSFRRTTT